MNNLFLLIKAATVIYYAHRLKDNNVLDEALSLVQDIPKTKNSLVASDKKVETLLRKLIDWLSEQPRDSVIITSLINTKLAEIISIAPDLNRGLEGMFEETDEQSMRQVIFQNIKEIKNTINTSLLNFKLKSILKPFLFEGDDDLTKDNWLKLADLLEEKIGSYQQDVDRAVIEKATSENTEGIVKILDDFMIDLSADSIIKTGLQGINKALGPDFGLRRGLFYLINALTNRGKSFFLAHVLASAVLYNKPKLKDNSKLPTIFFCSAEDSMGLVLRRMFEIFHTVKYGEKPDFFKYTSGQVVDEIMKTFNENGWHFAFFRVDPSHDNIIEFKQRVRNLELKGHEIILSAYDYAGMMDLKGCHGETRSDRLQDLIRQMRNFLIARGAIGITPHQLNPRAKELLRENDDESEVRFVREVGGHSMTEGSTKLTNEVDVELTIHIAKLINNEVWFTYFIGKIRGEGSDISDRYGMYKIDQGTKEKLGKGLVHDINEPKSMCKKTLTSQLNSALDLSEI